MKILLTAGVDTDKHNACLINLYRNAKAFTDVDSNEVFLFTPKPHNDSFLKFDKIVTKKGFSNNKLPNSLNFFLNIPGLVRFVNRRKIDVVVVRFNLLSFFLTFCLRLFSNAFIVTEHHGWVEDELIATRKKYVAKFFRYLQILDAKYAHMVRVVVDGLKKKLVENSIEAQKIMVFQNGTDVDFFDESRAVVKRKGNITYNVGFLGNLVHWQGVHIAVEAFSLLKMKRDDIRLTIVGGGPERKKLERLVGGLGVSDLVNFVDEVSILEVPQILGTFDIALAPYTLKRNVNIGISPIKIRDYAAYGLPIIASAIEGVSAYEWLLTVEPDNPESLARKIAELCDNEILREKMKKMSRAYALENFDMKQLNKLYLKEITTRKAS